MAQDKREQVMILCAHSDDQIIGAGGTLARYAEEGKEITTVIFSYGETTHFWLQRKYSVEMRVNESQEANKIIGGGELIFLGLSEGKFKEEAEAKGIVEKIKKLIREKKPVKVFTHSFDDAHPDHRDVLSVVLDCLEENSSVDVYTFDIWNLLDIRKRSYPKMYVDITASFKTKLKALDRFRSQRFVVLEFLPLIYVSSFLNGLHSNCRNAEKFYKIH